MVLGGDFHQILSNLHKRMAKTQFRFHDVYVLGIT